MSFSQTREAFIKVLSETEFEVWKMFFLNNSSFFKFQLDNLKQMLRAMKHGKKIQDELEYGESDDSDELDVDHEKHRRLEKQIIKLLIEYLE